MMMMICSFKQMFLFLVILFMLDISVSDGGILGPQWCIADEQMPDDVLQEALDWACGLGGADCNLIQPNKPCYLPNNMRNHATYAFNSYWQKFKNKGGSCYFNGAAMVTDLNPSLLRCLARCPPCASVAVCPCKHCCPPPVQASPCACASTVARDYTSGYHAFFPRLNFHYQEEMTSTYSFAEFLDVSVDAAKKAGEVIRRGFYKTKHVEYKGQVDLVTETDKECEELIFNHLKKHFPSHKFIGEESSAALGTFELTDDPTWIVDPLDGTTNFVHGFPFVCVSIGLTIEKVPTVGVVYNPISNELFTGIRGQGAFLNGNLIKASSQTELLKSLLATEVGSTRDKATVDDTTNRINSLLFKVRSLRMDGSCALNLCGVACGRLDIFYELGFGGPWDVAGGAAILQEAGGLIFDPYGGDFDIMSRRVAASNGHLKDLLLGALREAEGNDA